MNPQHWVPIRWPTEPVWWRKPESLDLLRNTPINCLIAEPKGALADEARRRGLAIASTDNPGVVAVNDAEWPQIPMQAGGGSGGPTGNPWITSNGWRIQLAQAKSPEQVVWVMAEPPKNAALLRAEAYQVAIADAMMHGARWPIALDSRFRDAFSRGEQKPAWGRLMDTIRTLSGRQAGPPAARLGVCSDFLGPNEYLAHEVLNLGSRRLLAYRVVDKNRMSPEALQDLRAVLWIDDKAPQGSALETLNRFVESGGTLIVPASAAHLTDGLTAAPRQEHSYAIYSKGQGRIAVARQPWNDPYVVAADAHMVMGRRYDVVRMWNAGTCLTRFSEADDRGTAQILNFAGRQPAHDVSLYVAHPYRTARFTCLETKEPRLLEVVKRETGVEVNVPAFAVYAAIEFGA